MADENKEYMPRLRFPEFRGPTTWEISPLSKVIKTIIPPKKILTQEYEKGGKIPIIDQSKEKIAGYTNDLSSVIKINKPVIVFGDHTCIIKYIDFDFAQGADGIKIIDPINIIPRYLFEYLCYFPVNPTGYSRHFSILKEKSIGFPPSIKEQQKIADCLSSLDELIEAHEQKRDALVEHKKGLMQRLFPTEGETSPRWRFPEFKKSGEWENKHLGDMVNFLSGFPFDGKDIVSDTSGCKLLRGINITEGSIRHSSEIDRYFCGETSSLEKYRLVCDDIVIGMDGSKVGKNSALITKIDEGSLLVQRVARLRVSKQNSTNYIFQNIRSKRFIDYVDKINTSSGIPHISGEQIKSFVIPMPHLPEQQKIADCLSSLDARIEAEEAKIASLREHKQCLMQRLFPQSL